MTQHLEMSNGNSKIGNNTLIFNMGSALNCPSKALGLCKVLNERGECCCYAGKAERLYPQVLPYREKQHSYWSECTAEQFVADFDAQLDKSNALRTRVRFFRFNEAGDFHSQAEVIKAEQIAQALRERGIVCYTYTARADLDFTGCKALLVKGSSHEGGNNGMTIARKRGAALEQAKAEGFVECPGSCKTCNLCKRSNRVNIVFPLH
jgi:hypothetical protein